MTTPFAVDDFNFAPDDGLGAISDAFEDQSGGLGGQEPSPTHPRAGGRIPPPIVKGLSDAKKDTLRNWLDERIREMQMSQDAKQAEWADLEKAYRAVGKATKNYPFKGSSALIVPVIAMAVDPIHARLDTGIFKQDPVFTLRALKSSALEYVDSLETWINFYFKNILKFRSIASPRLLEFAKLGTMVFKVVYEKEDASVVKYDDNDEVIKTSEVRFSGPRPIGISLGDFLFPPGYQHVQDCPIVAERVRTTYLRLKVAEDSKQIANVDKIKSEDRYDRTELETERMQAVSHEDSSTERNDLIVYECWFDFDIDGDGLPESMVALYHLETRTLLRLQYNFYYAQKKPYVVIPYTVSNESLYGIGIAEMSKPFQDMITQWERMASDNAYLANIRMWGVKRDAPGLNEESMQVYAGRQIPLDDPSKDLREIRLSDIYPSTINERQNLFGLVEKRTGVSDYLTGRESPIIGSRATATSTLALIQEGTKRVEEVLENIRSGFSEMVEMCVAIWIQFGCDGLDSYVFGDDEVYADLQKFFSLVDMKSVNGAVAIDLTATDAASNRQTMQQVQLQIIQTMLGYIDRVQQMGQMAMQATQGGQPELAALANDSVLAMKAMFNDLLGKYDIRNAEQYLPDLEAHLAALNQRLSASQPMAPNGPTGAGEELTRTLETPGWLYLRGQFDALLQQARVELETRTANTERDFVRLQGGIHAYREVLTLGEELTRDISRLLKERASNGGESRDDPDGD